MNPKESTDRKLMNEDEFVKDVNNALDYGYGPHVKLVWKRRNVFLA